MIGRTNSTESSPLLKGADAPVGLGDGEAERAVHFFELGSLMGAIGALLVGFSVLLGWLWNQPRLTSWSSALKSSNPLTACSLALAGASLLALHRDSNSLASRILRILSSLFVVVVGAICLLQWLGVSPTAIDGFVVGNHMMPGGQQPSARMAPSTAICLFAAGLVLTRCAFPGAKRRSFVAELALLCALLVSLMALIGYAFRARTSIDWLGPSPCRSLRQSALVAWPPGCCCMIQGTDRCDFSLVVVLEVRWHAGLFLHASSCRHSLGVSCSSGPSRVG